MTHRSAHPPPLCAPWRAALLRRVLAVGAVRDAIRLTRFGERRIVDGSAGGCRSRGASRERLGCGETRSDRGHAHAAGRGGRLRAALLGGRVRVLGGAPAETPAAIRAADRATGRRPAPAAAPARGVDRVGGAVHARAPAVGGGGASRPADSSRHARPTRRVTPGRLVASRPADSSRRARPTRRVAPGRLVASRPADSSCRARSTRRVAPGRLVVSRPADSSRHARPTRRVTPGRLVASRPADSSRHARPTLASRPGPRETATVCTPPPFLTRFAPPCDLARDLGGKPCEGFWGVARGRPRSTGAAAAGRGIDGLQSPFLGALGPGVPGAPPR